MTKNKKKGHTTLKIQERKLRTSGKTDDGKRKKNHWKGKIWERSLRNVEKTWKTRKKEHPPLEI